MEIQGRKIDPRKLRRKKNVVPVGSKKTSILLITTLFLLTSLLLSCDGGVGFGIFLVDSGELVLSEQHIKKYCKDTHEIELNEEGIEKWNSYMTYEAIPRLDKSLLFEEDFLVTIEGTEAYRGHFSSIAVSVIPPGVTIVDTLFKLESEHNTIKIDIGFPYFVNGDDPRNNQDIFDFFEKRGMLGRAVPCGSNIW